MPSEPTMLQALHDITMIAAGRRLRFEKKLQLIVERVSECLQAQKTSIMLRYGRNCLAVVASTNPGIVGARQTLNGDSPSAWVVKNKQPLYVDSRHACTCTTGRYPHYTSEAFYLAPILNGRRVTGVLSITEKRGTDVFSREERELLLQVTGQIILALENNRLAQSLKKQRRTLLQKNRELQKLEKLRTDLFNMLIHDLKGPVSEIVANLDVLACTLEGESLECVETAQAGCNSLYSMVSNLLDIARLEEGQMQLVHERMSPEALVREALAGLLVSVRSKSISFAQECRIDPETTITADRGLLLRVFQNLLSNAIRYSPPQGCITVGCRATHAGGVEFFVRDAGPGVPENLRETIFDKYKQLDGRRGTVYTAGLGLAFCRMAIQAHGGTIGVACPQEGGSRFWFTIPETRTPSGCRGR